MMSRLLLEVVAVTTGTGGGGKSHGQAGKEGRMRGRKAAGTPAPLALLITPMRWQSIPRVGKDWMRQGFLSRSQGAAQLGDREGGVGLCV